MSKLKIFLLFTLTIYSTIKIIEASNPSIQLIAPTENSFDTVVATTDNPLLIQATYNSNEFSDSEVEMLCIIKKRLSKYNRTVYGSKWKWIKRYRVTGKSISYSWDGTNRINNPLMDEKLCKIIIKAIHPNGKEHLVKKYYIQTNETIEEPTDEPETDEPEVKNEPETSDTNPPIITIASHENNSFTKQEIITIEGNILEENLLSATLNGTNLDVNPDGSFSMEVNLSEGSNEINIQAQDLAGNSSTQSITLNLDTTEPSVDLVTSQIDENQWQITIVFNEDGSGLNLNTFSLIIDQTDYTEQCNVNTQQAIFNFDISDLGGGHHQGIINISDNVNNTTYTNIPFTLQEAPAPEEVEESGYIDGFVINAITQEPVINAEITAETNDSSIDSSGTIYSDENGFFAFPIPDDGDYIVHIKKENYTESVRNISANKNRDVGLGNIALTPLDSAKTTIDSTGGLHTSSDGSIIVDFPEGAVPEGTQIEVSSTNYVDKDTLPGPLPETSIFTYCIELLPNMNFERDVHVKLKNTRGFAAGLSIPVGYLDRTTGQWIHHSLGQISSDGQWVEFSTNHFTPFDCNYPPPVRQKPNGEDSSEADDDCDDKNDCKCKAKDQSGSAVSLASGELELEYSLPALNYYNDSYDLTFEYSSLTANPNKILSLKKTNQQFTITPDSHTVQFSVQGVVTDEKFFEGSDDEAIYKYYFDGQNVQGQTLTTGVYDYSISVSNDYFVEFYTANSFGGGPISSTGIQTDYVVPYKDTINGEFILINQENSDFGAGWNLKGFGSLNIDDDTLISIRGNHGKKYKKIYENLYLSYPSYPASTIVVSPVAGIKLKEIVSSYVNDVIVSSAGEYTYFITEDYIKKFNSFNFKYLNEIQLDDFIEDFSLSPNDDKLYAVTSDKIYVINAENMETINSISKGFGHSSIKASPNGSFYYTSSIYNSAYAVLIFDATNDSFIDYIPLGSTQSYKINNLAITPDGNQLYCLHQYNNIISVIDISSLEVQDPIIFEDGYIYYYNPVFSKDGKKAYIYSQNRFEVIDVDSNTITHSIQFSNDISNPPVVLTLSKDGSRLYGFSEDQLYVIDAINDEVLTNETLWIETGYPENSPERITTIPTNFSEETFIADDGATITFKNNQYTEKLLDGLEITYDMHGNTIKKVHPNGHIVSYEYIDDELLSKISLNTNTYWLLNYTNQKLSSISDSAGRTTYFTIDNEHNLVSINDASSSKRLFSYGENHLAIQKITENGSTFQYQYDQYGRIKTVSAPERDVYDVNNMNLSREIEHRHYYPSAVKGLINDLAVEDGTLNQLATNLTDDTNYNEVSGSSCTCTALTSTTNKYGAYLNKTDALGNITTYTRNSNNLILKTTFSNGKYEVNDYDDKENLISKKYFSNLHEELKSEFWSYEEKYNAIKTHIDSEGNTTTYYYEYEESELGDLNNDGITDRTTNNIIRIEYPQVELNAVLTTPVEQFIYDNNGNLILEKDKNGNTTTYEYNASGYMTQMILGYGSSTPAITTYSQFDSAGNPGQITNPNGYTKHLTYNFRNQITSVSESIQGETYKTEFNYDNEGNLIQKIEKNLSSGDSITENYQYNELNQLTQTIAFKDGITAIEKLFYNIHRKLAAVEDSLGNITTYHYDDALQLVKQVDSQGYETIYEYNSNRLLSKITTPDGLEKLYAYNDLSQKIEEAVDASNLNLISHFTYNTNGELLTSTDPKGLTTIQIYDSLDRLTQTIDPSGNATNYQYDLNGNLLQITDANGNNTNYTYDSLNRLSSVTYADSTTENYIYDNNGNIIQFTDRNGQTINFTWDERDRLIQKTYSDANTATFNYDYLNNIIFASETRYGSSITNTYLHKNLLSSSNQNGLTVSFNYDNQGNRTGITYPNGEITTYSYDPFNRIKDIQNNEGTSLVDYSYNPNGTLSSITRSNNTETLYSYDSAQRLINLVHQISNNPFTDLLYGYDLNSNRIFQSDSVNSGIGEAYQYDDINQLIHTAYGSNNPSQEANSQGSTSINRYTSFNFDPLGNRLSVDQNGKAVNYGPNNGSQLTNVANQYESVDSTSLTYDDNGNLLSDGNLTITWDQDNKISSILNNSTGITTHYKYDALGRRIEKDVDGDITKYLYDGEWSIVEDYNVSNVLQRRFIQGQNIDEWIALVDYTGESSNTHFYHADILGSITHLTNSVGQVIEKYQYDVFGKPYIYNSIDESINESALSNPYLFTGRRIDPESKLYYYRFRYYSSSLGRFISNDPVGYIDGLNTYSYCLNNPINHTDVYGLSIQQKTICIIACYLGMSVKEFASLWDGDKIPRSLRREYELKLRKQYKKQLKTLTKRQKRNFINNQIKKQAKVIARKAVYKKFGAKVFTKVGPNAIPGLGQLLSILMTAGDVIKVCECAYLCSKGKYK